MSALELRLALKRLRLRQGAFAQILGKHRVTVGRWANSELEIPKYVAAYLELAERCDAVGVWDLTGLVMPREDGSTGTECGHCGEQHAQTSPCPTN